MTDALGVAVVGLAAWRIASLLVNEAGPFDIFVRLRRWARVPDPMHPTDEPRPFIGGVLSCVWCASIWLAAGLWVVWENEHQAVLWLAAASIPPVIDRIVRE